MQDRRAPTDLLDATSVGRRLGVDPTTVYRMAADGRLKGVKVGRQWRFAAADVDRALRVGVPPVAQAPEPWPAAIAPDGPPRSARPAPHEAGGWRDPAALRAVVAFAAEALGVMMVVTDMDGRPVTPVANPCPALADRLEERGALATCSLEWRALAADPDFEPRFRRGALGFECARAMIRSGATLVGTVLAGGIAPAGDERADDGLYHLDDERRGRVLRLLPQLATTLSRLAGHPDAAHDPQGGPR